MSSNLASKLRTGTRQSHTAAENVGFMKCFLKGVVDRDSFAKLLGNLYFIYSELERALQSYASHPLLGKIYFPELNRVANLEKDLEFYYGKSWRERIAPSQAAEPYIERIREIAVSDPLLLLAHCYTRYMGDLSGGQLLQKIAQTSLKLVGYEGTAFYNFEEIPDKKTFKDGYRQALNDLPIDEATIERIVDEANLAFQLNIRMAQELDGSLIKAIGQLVFHSLTRPSNPGSTELATADYTI